MIFYHSYSHIHIPGVSAISIEAGGGSVNFVDTGHTCVIVTGGDVMCWGLNDAGQLGIGSAIAQKIPKAVVLGAGASVRHWCAVVKKLE